MSETIFTNRCSFCGKQQDQVERLIAGPRGMFICNECIDLCREIIEEKGTIAFFSTESPLFLLCASCGARCRRTDHYCFNCGQKLEQKASSDFSKQALLAEASPHQHRQNRGMADTYHVFLHFRHFQEMACYRLSWP